MDLKQHFPNFIKKDQGALVEELFFFLLDKCRENHKKDKVKTTSEMAMDYIWSKRIYTFSEIDFKYFIYVMRELGFIRKQSIIKDCVTLKGLWLLYANSI